MTTRIFGTTVTREQKRLWAVAGGILVAGTAFKTAYFQFSRGLMLDDMTSRHVRAQSHLREAREYARRAAVDREARAPTLTYEQREQLRRYLELLAERNPDVHPRGADGGGGGGGRGRVGAEMERRGLEEMEGRAGGGALGGGWD